MPEPPTLPLRRIAVFWLPLWATWLMMAVEGPFLAAIIARLADPTTNLAAFGVAYSFALIVESPVIMMMSASTALVGDARSLRLLRSFTFLLCGVITAAMVVLVLPPVFHLVAARILDLPASLVTRTHVAVALLLPWPGAIGYRRFYQGVLIRHGLTRRVAYGTVLRVLTMAGTALALQRLALPGAWVGALALAAGVTAEAFASRVMAAGIVGRLLRGGDGEASATLTFPSVARFYAPLALTSMLTLAVQPLVTLFVAHGRAAVESLAVLPVVTGLVFIFHTLGLAYQETGIALIGEHRENHGQLRRFATLLGVVAGAGLAAVAWTPLAAWWYGTVSGLRPDLAAFAVAPTRIVTIMPALTVLLSFQRAVLVSRRVTRPITWATLAEVGGIATTLGVAVIGFDAVGAIAATAALLVGRLAANLTLIAPLRPLAGPHAA